MGEKRESVLRLLRKQNNGQALWPYGVRNGQRVAGFGERERNWTFARLSAHPFGFDSSDVR